MLEDAYEFLTQCKVMSLDAEALICECIVCPDTFKFDLASQNLLDDITFKVNLLEQTIDLESIRVNEALTDIPVRAKQN